MVFREGGGRMFAAEPPKLRTPDVPAPAPQEMGNVPHSELDIEVHQQTPENAPEQVADKETDWKQTFSDPEYWKREAERTPEEEVRERNVALAGLEALRPVIKDETIFASMAMFLFAQHEKAAGNPNWREFDNPPGDLDIAVADESRLLEIREQLLRIPGVKLEKDGALQGMRSQPDTKRLAGEIWLQVEGEEKPQKFEFEFYSNSRRIINETDERNPMEYNGFHFLDPAALHRQYENNLKMEQKIEKNVEAIASFLMHEKLQAFRKSFENETTPDTVEEAVQLLESSGVDRDQAIMIAEGIKELDLRKSDIGKMYKIQKALEALKAEQEEGNSEAIEMAISERSKALTGGELKTKTYKRIRNIYHLSQLRASAPTRPSEFTRKDWKEEQQAARDRQMAESDDQTDEVLLAAK